MQTNKESYADTLRRAALDALCNPKQKLTGTMRRRLMRATERVYVPADEPKESATRLSEKFARRPISSLTKWRRRTSSRLAKVKVAIEDAMSLGLTKAVDALSVKRDRMTEVLNGLLFELSFRQDRAARVTFSRRTGKYVTTT